MSSANITSIEALRRFRAALVEFASDVQDAITMLELESWRSQEWIENDRAFYWRKQVQKATEMLSEAKLALERCELTINAEDRRSCYDERKMVQKAKWRLELSETKVKAVGRWKIRLRKEVHDFKVQLAKIKQYLDSDFVKGLVALENMAQALDRYVELDPARGSTTRHGSQSSAPDPGPVPPTSSSANLKESEEPS